MQKPSYEAMVAWGTVVTALGVIFGGWQVVLVGRQVRDAAQQTELAAKQVQSASEQTVLLKQVVEKYFDLSRRETANNVLIQWDRAQPTNASPCLELMSLLDQQTFGAVVNRQSADLPPTLAEYTLRCFSDFDADNVKRLFDENKLSRQGSSVLVDRVRGAINSDEEAARAVKYSISDREMTVEGMRNVADYDSKIINKLDVHLGRKTYVPLREFLDSFAPPMNPKPPL